MISDWFSLKSQHVLRHPHARNTSPRSKGAKGPPPRQTQNRAKPSRRWRRRLSPFAAAGWCQPPSLQFGVSCFVYKQDVRFRVSAPSLRVEACALGFNFRVGGFGVVQPPLTLACTAFFSYSTFPEPFQHRVPVRGLHAGCFESNTTHGASG